MAAVAIPATPAAVAIPATPAATGFNLSRPAKTLSLSPLPLLGSRKSPFPNLKRLGTYGGIRAPSIRQVTRTQSSPDYLPDAEFYKIEAILRPWRVGQVSSGMLKMGIRGVTVSDVKGFGAQGGSRERHAGSEFTEDKLVVKTKMEIIVSKNQVESVIEKILEEARTGEIGDGKIFVMPVSDVIRIRTGERGEMAEKMTGGHSEALSSTS